ncbi:MAG: ABC transporter ATP-binding protein, partial [Clostridia bacterium]|nr:ABC transporter ATP-binding protein [Clostridia bacterium]
RLNQYVCLFSDYVTAQTQAQEEAKREEKKAKETAQAQRRERPRELRMTFKEQNDYKTIDALIESLNEKLEDIDAQIMANASNYVKLSELSALKEKTEQELAQAEERWLYLTDLAERIEAQKTGK